MIWDYPSKNVEAPYTVTPNDLGLTLNVMTAGDVTFGPLLNMTDARFSILVQNQSSGDVVLRTLGNYLRRNGQTPALGSMLIPAGETALMGAIVDSLDWLGANVSTTVSAPAPSPSPSPSPAPVGSLGAVLYWGPGSIDTFNGGVWNANPALPLGGTYPFVVHVSNPIATPLTATITEVYQGVNAGTNFGNIPVPANGTITLNGTITVAGTVGSTGFIRLTLTDIYGGAQRADIPFTIAAP